MNEVEAITADLARIVDQARWAHVHGYVKAGHGLTIEHGTDLSKTEKKRNEGPTYDLQIGDHWSRVAYQRAIRAVTRADVHLARCLYDDGLTLQPNLAVLDTYAHPAQLALAASSVYWRLQRIDQVKHARRLTAIRKAFDSRVRGLSRALDHGPADGIAHNETPCKTCRIRPQAEREKADGTTRAVKAGECDTCATYRRRNGITRPVELDSGPVNEARAAQARRIARGEGWGAA